MKQKISFNPNIYIETLRQLRVIGIISAIVMAGIIILRIAAILPYTADDYFYKYTYTGSDWMPWLIITFMILVPLMMFQAFHFMDKRNSSDFYHSLPHTRLSLYISISAAIMTWVVISILVTIIPSLLAALFFSKYVIIAYKSFFLFTLFCLSSCFLVGGAILIAKGLTGTIFNGIILSGIILFVPRILITLFISSIEANPVFFGFIGNAFTRNDLNPVTSTVFGIMGIESYIDSDSLFVSVPAIVYGFVLGIIYFVLGGIAFCRRSSETASQSAPSRRLQAVYRILIAVTFSSLVVAELFKEKHIYRNDSMSLVAVITCYLAIVFAYFLYELISTKKLKNLVRAIPGLGIVAVLNFAMYFGLSASYKSEMNFRPSPDEINSITVIPVVSKYNDSSISYYDYALNKIGGVEITDKQVIEDISAGLDKNLSMTESGNRMLYTNQNIISIPVKINTNGASKSRNIFINMDQYDNMNKSVCSSKEFEKAWMSPPSLESTKNIYVTDYVTGRTLTYDENSEEMYQMFLDEIRNADFKTWFNAFVESDIDMNFRYSYVIGGKSYELQVPVSKKIAPKTVEKCREISYEKQKQEITLMNKYIEKLEKSGASYSGEIYVYIYDKNDSVFDMSFEFSDSLDIVTKIMESPDEYKTGDKTSPYFMDVNINFYNVDSDDIDGQGFSYSFNANEETLKKVKAVKDEYLKDEEPVSYRYN